MSWNRKYSKTAVGLLFLSVVLSGCGAGTGQHQRGTVVESVCQNIPATAELPGYTGEVFSVGAGRYALVDNSELIVVEEDGSNRQVYAAGVEQLFGSYTAGSGWSLVYSTVAVDGESELHLQSLEEGRETRSLGAAAAPEYQVIAVEYDRIRDEWVVTAISDLTETIAIYDGVSLKQKRVLEPNPYNDRYTVLVAVPNNERAGYLTVEESYDETGKTNSKNWRVSQLNREGQIITTTTVPTVFGDRNGKIDTSPLLDGLLLLGGDNYALVVKENPKGEITFVPACEESPTARLKR